MWKKDKIENRGVPADGNATAQDGSQESLSGESLDGGDVIAFVGKGVEFKGIISYDGTVRIDGHLDGEVHTDGTLLVGEDATLSAKVSAGTVISKGKITGDIVAREKVRLLSPAVLTGSVKTPVLSMEEGVLFNGDCEMSCAEVRELPRETMARAANAGRQ